MLYTDLNELKKILEIDPSNKNEDVKLNFFIEYATEIVEEYLNRRDGLVLKTRTEYYQGTGTPYLTLRSRPVFLTPNPPTVYLDEGAYYGSVTGSFDPVLSLLTYGTDYCLKIDQDTTASRSAILIRFNGEWPKLIMRERGWLSPFRGRDPGSIKITYTAGYAIDTLPASIRFAMNLMIAKMRSLLPTGMEVGGESFQDRSMSFTPNQRQYLMNLAIPHLMPFRNWKW
jgi:hypothetical protein